MVLPTAADTAIPDTEAARILGCSVACLRAWRLQGRGPAFVRLGRRLVRYRLIDLQEYVARHRVPPTHDG